MRFRESNCTAKPRAELGELKVAFSARFSTVQAKGENCFSMRWPSSAKVVVFSRKPATALFPLRPQCRSSRAGSARHSATSQEAARPGFYFRLHGEALPESFRLPIFRGSYRRAGMRLLRLLL